MLPLDVARRMIDALGTVALPGLFACGLLRASGVFDAFVAPLSLPPGLAEAFVQIIAGAVAVVHAAAWSHE